ncbi:MAG TPA: diguanylate cyclase, partial [Ilumatobacteraceae bacterium]|nr:diguanylate cyclase [Ilumatobacteraceae bacterium]
HVDRLTFESTPDLHVTVSIGATDHHGMQRILDAIDDADRVLYEAKAAGRNEVRTSWGDVAALAEPALTLT